MGCASSTARHSVVAEPTHTNPAKEKPASIPAPQANEPTPFATNGENEADANAKSSYHSDAAVAGNGNPPANHSDNDDGEQAQAQEPEREDAAQTKDPAGAQVDMGLPLFGLPEIDEAERKAILEASLNNLDDMDPTMYEQDPGALYSPRVSPRAEENAVQEASGEQAAQEENAVQEAPGVENSGEEPLGEEAGVTEGA